MTFDLLESIIIVLAVALTATAAFRMVQLPVILGYLLVGMLAGPFGLAWIPDMETIRFLAGFGVVFLMFTIGLEFSFPKLAALKYPVFILGSLQVILTVASITTIGMLINIPVITSLVIGCIVAMSSTAVVIKQLSSQVELHAEHGLNATGILLFQDLAVIPIIILIASLANGATQQTLTATLVAATFKGVLAALIMLATGRWFLRPWFSIIAGTKLAELFTFAVLLVTLAAAWLTEYLGLSYALGAFFAGIMLSETEFRHAIEVEIRPFRDVFLGLFFITIGMLIDVRVWAETWPWILLLLTALMLGKTVLIFIISRVSRYSLTTSLRTSLVLAQGGEFGFAILTVALNHNLLSSDYAQVILSALLISIAISSIIIRYNSMIAKKCLRKKITSNAVHALEKTSAPIVDSVVICGYGYFGQQVASLLKQVNLNYAAIDLDVTHVKKAVKQHEPVIYADATHPDILNRIGILDAKAVIIALRDIKAGKRIIHYIRKHNDTIPIIARCEHHRDIEKLLELGATKVIAEKLEACHALAYQLLLSLNVQPAQAMQLIQALRS